MTKTKRRIIKAVKEWCDQNGHKFITYEHGKKGHDFVKVRLWDTQDVKVTVCSTPRGGSQKAAQMAVGGLNKKAIKLRQDIIEGRFNTRNCH